MPTVVGGRPPILLKFALKVIHPFWTQRFRPIPLIALQLWDLAKNVRSALIGNRPCAFQRAIDEPCTLPLSPAQEEVCYKVPLCENLRRQCCSYIIPQSNVYRWIAGDVPIYLNFALKVTHPFRKRQFRQISLNSASAVRASEKKSITCVSLIGNRQYAFHRAIGEPLRYPYISHPFKGWLKTRIFTRATLCLRGY